MYRSEKNSLIYTGGLNNPTAYIENIDQSTTGNIYGIYDMSGGSGEYVMGNMSSNTGSYVYNEQKAGTNFTYATNTVKYIDTYAYGSAYNNQTAYNRSRLGDATGECVLSTGSNGKSWHNGSQTFPSRGDIYNENSWFGRGASIINDLTSVFSFVGGKGNANSYYSTRAVLTHA